MPIHLPKAVPQFAQAKSPAEFKLKAFDLLKNVLPDVELAGNDVLVVGYVRPELQRGIIVPVDEDVWQGKSGLVVKMGPMAFVDDEINKFSLRPEVGDWVGYWIHSARLFNLCDVPCRLIEDSFIKLRVKDPAVLF
jgi:hypothetical protein